jgi:hypothetical protein
LIIRRAQLSDIDIILEGAKQFTDSIGSADKGLIFDREKARPYFTMMIQSPLFLVLVAEDHQGKVVGSIGVSLSPWFCNTELYLADEVFWFVFPWARGLMVGPRLKKQMEREAQMLGATTVSISLMAQSENAEKLDRYYKKTGYELLESKYVKQMGGF